MTATDETAGQARYSAVAIWLHWLIAGALAFQIALGFAMSQCSQIATAL